jgi:hypothetical protein
MGEDDAGRMGEAVVLGADRTLASPATLAAGAL